MDCVGAVTRFVNPLNSGLVTLEHTGFSMKRICLLISVFLLAAGCSKKPEPQKPVSSVASQQGIAAASTAAALPIEEPSEEVLRELEFKTYEAIERAGGIPVTVSATGKSLTLRPKLYSVRKESCTPTPQRPAGWYECTLTIKLSLAADGRNPTEQGERIGVKLDSTGKWVLQ
ncbi:MAG: hypothetical protein ABI777_05460 [Betaproteobacteria bacterium]